MDDMELPPLNEWIAEEYTRTKEKLANLADAHVDLGRRHHEILDRLNEVCQHNDKLRAAGGELKAIIHEGLIVTKDDALIERIDNALERWEELDA